MSDILTFGFGESVAVSGNTIVVGADQGLCSIEVPCEFDAAYVFRFDGAEWIEEARLTAPDELDPGQFGPDVAVSGDTIAVAAPLDECSSGTNCGAVYVFRRHAGTPDSWAFESKLTASENAAGDRFGVSIAVDHNVIVVGAMGADCGAGPDCGAVYVYRFEDNTPESWVQEGLRG